MSIKDHLKNFKDKNKKQFLNDSIKAMEEKLDPYWNRIKEHAMICHLLDPRFKDSLISEKDLKKKG